MVRKSLEDYLSLEYPFHVIADPDGGYVVEFPDLPGCLTQVDSLEELPAMVEEARRIWITTAYEHGMDISLPSQPEEYSGKINLRVPRTLHRSLAGAAERQGVSLNQYVVMLLARGDVQDRVEHRLDALEQRLTDAANVSMQQQRLNGTPQRAEGEARRALVRRHE